MTRDRQPNLFILGAPKCGTTTLATWLSEHPQLFMCPVKEPCYFNTDHHRTRTWSGGKYEWLFRKALPHHLSVAEASVWYLYSEVAIRNILTYGPGSRFIACLRNPIQMAPSLHQQQVFAGNEHIVEFQQAWRLQDERLGGRAVTRWCSVPAQLAYGPVCLLGAQLQRLYRQVEPHRVHTVILDDMASDPGREYRRILSFLGLEDDARRDFPRLNEAKERRSRVLRQTVQLLSITKTRMGIPPLGTRAGRLLNNLNRRPVRRPPLDPEMHCRLATYFESDVRRLGNLLDRDLSAWLDRK